jgi:glycosyltransferase involved in cell wall biosynthesis
MNQSKNRNLLLLLPYIDLGGGARRVQVYCKYLKLFGWNVSVVLYSKKVMRDVSAILGAETPLCISSDEKKIVEFSQKHKVDVVYAIFDGQYDSYLEKILLALKKISIKVVVNNVFSYYDERMFQLSDRVLFQTFYMGFIKFARALPSEMALPLHKLSYLTNPINAEYLEKYRLDPLERERLRRELGFTPEQCVVARFGRSDIIKWGDELLFSVLALRNDATVAFLLVGVPRSRKILLNLLMLILPSLRKSVVILPPTGDDAQLMAYMQACDVVGHSVNIGEGCSNAINECLYWGKPVITTMTPHCDNGQSEQVMHGVTGFFAQSASEWVGFIQYLARHPYVRQAMGRKAHTFVVTKIDGPIIAERFALILNDVVENKEARTLSKAQYEKYLAQYEHLLRQHPVYKPGAIWYKILRNARRVVNYLEHTYWNE